jgi:hypothetical protein
MRAAGPPGEMRRACGWQPQRPGFSKRSLGKYRDGRNKQIGLVSVRLALSVAGLGYAGAALHGG